MTEQPNACHDEFDAYLCASEGEPYTCEEWTLEIDRLVDALEDAKRRWKIAQECGVCLPAKFDQ